MKQSLFSARLSNGIVVLGEDLPGLESVAVAFHTPAGAIHDGPGRCGLANLSGEMMLRGAADRSSREIVEALEGAGIQWAQSVSTSHASFAGAMVARQLPVALPIYADILRRPRLPEEELDNARQMVLQNLAGTEDDPGHRVMQALRQLHFPHPWGMPSEGLSADVEGIGIGAVREFVAAKNFDFPTVMAEPEAMGVAFEAASGERFTGTPSYLVFTPDRALAAVHSGNLDESALEAFLLRHSKHTPSPTGARTP